MTPILMQVSGLLGATKDPRRCRPELIGPRMEVLELAVRDFVRRSTTLLDVSRIAAGNLRLEFTEVDFSRLVHGVVARAGVAARMARCSLEPDLEDGIVGSWDRLALEQVIENLLSNSIKFGAGRPIGIVLRSDGQNAELTLRDQGIGISEEDRARIFQRFERAVARREQGGFGIGLWLAHQLTVAMGGSIAVESTLGEGATFTVTLPLGRAEQGGRSDA
jgi:two-component system, OmpR family, sensor kinase